MQLTAQQLQQFAEEGWLFLPDCFSEAEVAILRDEAEAIYAEQRPEVWREKTGAPRTAFAAHTYNEAFRLLGNHPRLIRPVEQLFGDARQQRVTLHLTNRRLIEPGNAGSGRIKLCTELLNGRIAPLVVCDKGKPGESRRRKATRLQRARARHASRAADLH